MAIHKFTFVAIIIATFVLASCSKDDDNENGSNSDTHEYIDLGLPSGTLWATCNIGANRPEEYGDYFAWGETEGYYSGKNQFETYTYKWYSKGNGYTKYCTDTHSKYFDNKCILDPEDDAATVNWGRKWCMPTIAQYEELISNTTHMATLLNGVTGYMLTSRINGKHIFFPSAGFIDGNIFYYQGSSGGYWSCEKYKNVDGKVYAHNDGSRQSYSPERGCSIRPVRSKN